MERPATDLFLSLTPERVLDGRRGRRPRDATRSATRSTRSRTASTRWSWSTAAGVVAKFYRPGRWNEEQILEEHRFLAELDAEEIPVCPVRPFPDGEHAPAHRRHLLRALRPQGRPRAGRARRRGARGVWAGSSARIHNVGARRAAPTPPAPRRATTYVRADLAWLEDQAVVPRTRSRDRYLDAAASDRRRSPTARMAGRRRSCASTATSTSATSSCATASSASSTSTT